MCAGCWDLRLEKVGLPIEDKPSTALQTASLVVGFVALLPLPTVQVVALIIAIVGMVKVSSPEQRATRWRAVAGFILALIGIAIDVVLMAVAR